MSDGTSPISDAGSEAKEKVPLPFEEDVASSNSTSLQKSDGLNPISNAQELQSFLTETVVLSQENSTKKDIRSQLEANLIFNLHIQSFTFVSSEEMKERAVWEVDDLIFPERTINTALVVLACVKDGVVDDEVDKIVGTVESLTNQQYKFQIVLCRPSILDSCDTDTVFATSIFSTGYQSSGLRSTLPSVLFKHNDDPSRVVIMSPLHGKYASLANTPIQSEAFMQIAEVFVQDASVQPDNAMFSDLGFVIHDEVINRVVDIGLVEVRLKPGTNPHSEYCRKNNQDYIRVDVCKIVPMTEHVLCIDVIVRCSRFHMGTFPAKVFRCPEIPLWYLLVPINDRVKIQHGMSGALILGRRVGGICNVPLAILVIASRKVLPTKQNEYKSLSDDEKDKQYPSRRGLAMPLHLVDKYLSNHYSPCVKSLYSHLQLCDCNAHPLTFTNFEPLFREAHDRIQLEDAVFKVGERFNAWQRKSIESHVVGPENVLRGTPFGNSENVTTQSDPTHLSVAIETDEKDVSLPDDLLGTTEEEKFSSENCVGDLSSSPSDISSEGYGMSYGRATSTLFFNSMQIPVAGIPQ